MRLMPYGRQVMITETSGEESLRGLYLPPGALGDIRHGMVESVGPEVREVGVGDTVYYSRPLATIIFAGRTEYLLLGEPELLAKER